MPSGPEVVPTLSNPTNGFTGAVCSPGGLASLTGSGFTAQDPQQMTSTPLPTRLHGVQVKLNGSPAPLLSVSDSRVTFQCPMLSPDSALEVVLEDDNGASSDVVPSVMRAAAPGVFAYGDTNQGLIMIAGTNEIAMLKTDGVPSRPAHPGEYLTIYASGLGEVNEGVPAGMAVAPGRLITPINKVRVVIGDIEIQPAFAALAPGMPGLFQVNAQLPQETPLGSAIPLFLRVTLSDGTVIESNSTTLAAESVESR